MNTNGDMAKITVSDAAAIDAVRVDGISLMLYMTCTDGK